MSKGRPKMGNHSRRLAGLLWTVVLTAAVLVVQPAVARAVALPDIPLNGLAPTEIAEGDLNGDAVDDLAVANEAGNTVTVLLSHPTGGYQQPIRYPVGVSPSNVRIRDFTGDGLADVVDVDAGSNTISVLPNLGDGRLGQAISSPTATVGSAAMTVADFNQDGHRDVAVSNPLGTVAVTFGNGDGTFAAPATYPGPVGGIGIASADFNGDGYPDIASVGAASITQTILINNGDGTFNAGTVPIGPGAVCNRTADVNHDGSADIVSASADGYVGVLLGHGDGSFAPVRNYPTGGLYASCFGIDDLNGDGNLDLAVANIAGTSMSVLLGRGDGSFQQPAVNPARDAIITCGTAQVNADDATDVVCPGGALPVVVIFRGHGDGTFAPPTKISL